MDPETLSDQETLARARVLSGSSIIVTNESRPGNRFLVRRFHLDNDSVARYYPAMSKVADDILNEAMRLSTTERAALAAALLASLDGEPEDEVEAAWAAEIQRRTERVRSGEAKGRPWSEVRARLERRGE